MLEVAVQVTAMIGRRIVVSLACLFGTSAVACCAASLEDNLSTNPVKSGDEVGTLSFAGRLRVYLAHMPPGYDGCHKLPLVLMLHGGAGNYKYAVKMTGWSRKADEEGFIAVYPNGTGIFKNSFLTWNAGDCCGYAKAKAVDDIAFLRALIEMLKTKYPVDPERIYIAGFSNGAMLAYQAACELGDQIAAIAIVGGSMTGRERSFGHPLSVIIFHGLADDHVPYFGGAGKLAKWGYPVNREPVSYAVSFWAGNDDCVNKLARSEAGNVAVDRYCNGKNGTEVVLYTLKGAQHAWPGGKRAWFGADRPCKDISATDVIWDFFSKQPKASSLAEGILKQPR